MTNLPSRFQGIEIPSENPFQNDKLGFSQHASTLTGMVDIYKDCGCVISVNGKWGSGKTTFLQMWRASLPSDKYETVFFNAWETDFYTEPLIAILGELREISGESEKEKKLVSAAGKIALATGSALVKGLVKKYTGVDKEIIDETTDAIKSSFESSLDNYKSQKQSLSEFKDRLSEFVASQDKKTVVFIIDELDRCNPNYAVKVLETVKHLFDVPNICFILAIDKSQLECSIKGYYGSNEIDADNYLRRFIDIEFRMPAPNLEGFTNILFNHYKYKEVFDWLRTRTQDPGGDFCEMATALGMLYSTDLRTYDKIFAHTRLALGQLNNDAVLVDVVLFLCFLRVADDSFYTAIAKHKFSVQGLLDELEKRFPKQFLVQESYGSSAGRLAHSIVYMIGPLLILYNVIDGVTQENGINDLDESKELSLRCNIIDKETLKSSILWFSHYGSRSYGLSSVLKTVNLLRHF